MVLEKERPWNTLAAAGVSAPLAMLQPRMDTPLRKVNQEEYSLDPSRYELRTGQEEGAPLCPYGNHYQWIGFDKKTEEYLRFTKSVFRKLVRERGGGE